MELGKSPEKYSCSYDSAAAAAAADVSVIVVVAAVVVESLQLHYPA